MEAPPAYEENQSFINEQLLRTAAENENKVLREEMSLVKQELRFAKEELRQLRSELVATKMINSDLLSENKQLNDEIMKLQKNNPNNLVPREMLRQVWENMGEMSHENMYDVILVDKMYFKSWIGQSGLATNLSTLCESCYHNFRVIKNHKETNLTANTFAIVAGASKENISFYLKVNCDPTEKFYLKLDNITYGNFLILKAFAGKYLRL